MDRRKERGELGVRSGASELVRLVPSVRRAIAGSVALGLLATASVVAQAVCLGILLASAMPHADHRDRFAALVCLVSAVALRALCGLISEIVARAGSANVKGELREELAGSLLRCRPSDRTPVPSEIAALAGRGLDALDTYVGRCLPDMVVAAVAPAAMIVAVGALDWVSALILLVVVGLFPLFGILVGRSSMSLASDRWRRAQAFAARVSDTFQGLPILRAFGHTAKQRERIEEAEVALRSSTLSALRISFLSALVLDTLASVSVALVAVPLGLRLLTGAIPLWSALAILIIAPEVLLPLRRASAEFHESTEGVVAIARLTPLLQSSDQMQSHARGSWSNLRPSTDVPDPAKCEIKLVDVTVTIPDRGLSVLSGANLSMRPSQIVLVAGPNGTGKSTLISLLAGFVSPVGGRIEVGRVDLRDIDLASWREKVAYLPENPSVLRGTIAENLLLGNPSATAEDLTCLLGELGASDLLDELPDGLATFVGEGGRQLSSGERQIIAIARTILKPASLYLLDEPTVHLDDRTELAVVRTLDRVLEGKSALIVSHRPALKVLADQLVTIEGGAILPSSGVGREAREGIRTGPLVLAGPGR